MIQDIYPMNFANEYRPVPPTDDSYVIICENRSILMKKENGTISLPKISDFDKKYQSDYIYLFSVNNDNFYILKYFDDSIYDKYEFIYVEKLRQAKPKHLAFCAVTGLQLFTWYKNRQHCGRCGGKLEHSEKERMMFCPTCKIYEYPKISPAVIVGVYHKDKLLLSKYADREYKKYALLAGFAEIGETIEETIKREVMEEVGLQVKNIRYYKSQPWSFSDTLLFGFFAELDGSEDITLDKTELSTAEWFERDKIPVAYDGVSLTNEMIMMFKENKIDL